MANDEIARMKQVEGYKSKYMPRSFSETKDSPDSYWKHPQKKSQSFPVGRNSRWVNEAHLEELFFSNDEFEYPEGTRKL